MLLDDRRDACRALKALSRTYRIEVGAQGMCALRQILEMDRTDCEIIGLALDTLCNITNPKAFDGEGKNFMYLYRSILLVQFLLLLLYKYYFQWISIGPTSKWEKNLQKYLLKTQIAWD